MLVWDKSVELVCTWSELHKTFYAVMLKTGIIKVRETDSKEMQHIFMTLVGAFSVSFHISFARFALGRGL